MDEAENCPFRPVKLETPLSPVQIGFAEIATSIVFLFISWVHVIDPHWPGAREASETEHWKPLGCGHQYRHIRWIEIADLNHQGFTNIVNIDKEYIGVRKMGYPKIHCSMIIFHTNDIGPVLAR